MQGCPVETLPVYWSKRKYERRISVNGSRPWPPSSLNIRSATPKPDFEPEEWRSASDSVEDTLKPAVEKLEGELAEGLRVLSPPEDSKARAEYDNAMAELFRTVNEKYRQLLHRERQEVDKKGS